MESANGSPPGGWVNAGRCPICKTHCTLESDEESVFCPSCGWRPIELADDYDCGEFPTI